MQFKELVWNAETNWIKKAVWSHRFSSHFFCPRKELIQKQKYVFFILSHSSDRNVKACQIFGQPPRLKCPNTYWLTFWTTMNGCRRMNTINFQIINVSVPVLFRPEVSSSSCPATGRRWSGRPRWLQARPFTGTTRQHAASATRPSSQMAAGTCVLTARPSSVPAVGGESPWDLTR